MNSEKRTTKHRERQCEKLFFPAPQIHGLLEKHGQTNDFGSERPFNPTRRHAYLERCLMARRTRAALGDSWRERIGQNFVAKRIDRLFHADSGRNRRARKAFWQRGLA